MCRAVSFFRYGASYLVLTSIYSYDNLFRLPAQQLQAFRRETHWINDSSAVSDQIYIVEPGLYYNTGFEGSLIFTLQDGFVVEVPQYELAVPVRGLDPNGQRVLQSNVTVVNIFNNSAPEGTATLGKVFLSQAC